MSAPGDRRDLVIGVDIGGTCTDVAMIDTRSCEQFFFKTESLPDAVEQGVVNSIAKILEQENRRPEECAAFVHGTTLALNAVLTRRGARIGLLVTRGFGDILEIGRLQMPDPFNFYTRKPQPLVRKNYVREVEERILGNGRVDTPLDGASVEQAADELIVAGAEILVVCFVNSFKNSIHEREAATIVGRRHPSVPVSLSSQIWPEIREYERAMVTVMNAFVTPTIARYLDRLQTKLRDFGLHTPVNITTSNGGMLPTRLVRSRPGTTLLSGPASGVIASAQLAAHCGLRDVIAFDMGGTSSDFAMLTEARIPYSSETHIGDLPIIFPSVDVVSVGAGGGSIARLDNLGVLKVGPESAGAQPGPACYARGGVSPTVTDAYLATGMLDPESFLGGSVKLDADLAKKAIAELAAGTGYSVDELAEGIIRVATSNLILGVGKIEGRFGVDIRDFVVLAYGGAGPTHACILADQLGVRRVIVPVSPGTFCALGSLCADFRMDFVQTVNEPLDRPNWDEIGRWYADKEAEATRHLEEEAELIESVVALLAVDIRYEGQGFNTEVMIMDDILRTRDTVGLAAAFHERYEQLYGVAQPSVPGELVNLRLTMVGKRKISPRKACAPSAAPPDPSGSRSVFLDGRRQKLPVYRRIDLGSGAGLEGPCVVDQDDTTTFIRPNWRADVDAYGVIHLQRC